MYMYDKWIWIQYTPGAAGKLLCAVIQLSQNVDSWLPGLDKDYKNFVNNRILIKSNSHLKHEIMWPYNIDFYTRKLPFTRGDDLTSDQAEKIFKENFHYKKAGVIVMGLSSANQQQLNLFDTPNPKHKPLMQAVDKINAKFGRATIKQSSQDVKRTWKMKQEKLSQRYTTDLNDIIKVK